MWSWCSVVEKTGEQVLATSGIDGRLAKTQPREWNKKVRLMRRDPTIGIVRDLYSAPFYAADWTVVADDPAYEDAVSLVYRSIMPHRDHLLEHTIRGFLDFGWQAFERVLAISEDGWVMVKKFKPLLQDITDILVTVRGDLKGVRNLPTYLNMAHQQRNGPWVDLNKSECLVFSRDVEGTNLYGEPLMRRVEAPYDSWNDCEAAAKRYDTKIAGAQWIVYYPPGSTVVNGARADNFVTASKILDSLESGGKVAVPRKMLDQLDDLNDSSEDRMAWKIELMEASSNSESVFVGRQKYLDALKARGFGVPERAVFEGQFGTKAEAEAHADFAITNIETANTKLIAQVNEQAVDPLLEVNKGKSYKGHVKIKPAPLSDDKRAHLRELYMAFFNSEEGRAQESRAIDWDAAREQLAIPTHEDVDSSVDTVTVDGQPVATTSNVPSGEYTTLGRRHFKNHLKTVRDMRREVESGETPRSVAIELLQTVGIPADRAERILSDVKAPGDQ